MDAGQLAAGKWWRLLVLVMCLAFSAAVSWYQFKGGGKHSGLLTFFLLFIVYALINTGIVQLPPGSNIPFFAVWPRLSDALKAVISFLLIFPWTLIAVRLVLDTPVGVAIVLIPDAVFVLAALTYVSNGISRNLK
jgi:hypothetical protein